MLFSFPPQGWQAKISLKNRCPHCPPGRWTHKGGRTKSGYPLHKFLWYNGCTLSDSPSNSITPKCNQCGCNLVLVKKKTAQIGNSFSPMTTTTYRCSNQECQDEIDRRVCKRIELREERELARQNRLQLSSASKMISAKKLSLNP